jgi:hypothetical protein
MYRFRIVFTCLCAYLPRKDDVLVVIPDGRGEKADDHAGHGGPPVPMPMPAPAMAPAMVAVAPHVPVIEFDPADLSPRSELQPSLLFRRPGSRRDWGLFFLTGNDIRLDPAPSGAPVLRGGRVPGSKVPATPAEAEDFTWIAGVAELDAAAGVMDPTCVAPGKDAGGRVVARMSLQGGMLAAQLIGLDTSPNHDPIVFDFADANAPADTRKDRSQALAAAVAYDLAVTSEEVGEEVGLVLTNFKDGSENRLVFSFAGRPIGSAIEILIKNMPLDGVLELTDTIKPGAKVDVDAHFAMYYKLSATPPKKPWIPLATSARFGGPICPGARFTENEGDI